MSSRKRNHPAESDEDEGRLSTDEEDGEIQDSLHRGKGRSKKSKKHKKEKKHKSRKRRRRSQTPDDATDKEGGSTPDVEAGEVVEISDEERRSSSRRMSKSPIRATITKRSRSRSPPQNFKREKSPPKREKSPPKRERSPSPDVKADKGGSKDSLSIEETNKLRASIGLPPLKVNKPKVEDDKEEDDPNAAKDGKLIPNTNVRHKPAENLTEKSATEKMRERLQQRKVKRQQEQKLAKVGTLGADSGDEDASNWVKKQKKKLKEKKAAEKRAMMFEQLDDEFGVGDIVQKEMDKKYDSTNLAGLKVEHDSTQFNEGKSIILTLKDNDVLDEEAMDTLVNVNMLDDEKVAKNKEEIRKAKVGYNPYDQEEIDEETGELRRKNMLDKYDEEIDGTVKKKSFTIGSSGTFNQDQEREMNRAKIREKLAKVETLQTPQLRVASDFLTQEELDAKNLKFKKPKKKKKVKRKMLKADDLLALEAETSVKKEETTKGGLPMDWEASGDVEDVQAPIDDEEDDLHLQLALKKARKIKQKRNVSLKPEDLIDQIKEEPDEAETNGAEFIQTFADDRQWSNNVITMNETSEFCRQLGALKSYEPSGLTDKVPKEIRDFEQNLTGHHSSSMKRDDSSDDDELGTSSKFRRLDEEGSSSKDQVILDEEPDLKSGVAAAIKLASNKGYWEQEGKASKSEKLKHLEARNYTIEDKQSDDWHSRRDRYSGGGGSQSFQEKADYKPNVKLEYIDDEGRRLNQKEAFRYMSHKFHGKGSGKLKSEKRQKKMEEEHLMKTMSSTDTPLQTLEKLRKRQQEGATPFVILTGSKLQAADLKQF